MTPCIGFRLLEKKLSKNLRIIIPIADTWFSTTVTPTNVALFQRVTNSSNSFFGRDYYNSTNINNYCSFEEGHFDEGGNGWFLPCNMDYYYLPDDINRTTRWSYALTNANEAALTIANLSVINTVNDGYNAGNDQVQHYKYLANTGFDLTKDFRAKTIAVKTQCAPMTARCFPSYLSDNSSDLGYWRSLGSFYTFNCTPGFSGELTSNGASMATALRKNSSTGSMGIGFAPDAELSQMIGNNRSIVEFASFRNPLYFGTWSLGWQNMRYTDIGDNNYPLNHDPWDLDGNIFYDENYGYAWMLNCSMEVYYAEYDWINGTTHNFTPWLAEPGIGGMVSYPFVSGLPLAELCLQSTSSHMRKAINSSVLADQFADQFSACVIALMAANTDLVPTILEQSRNNNFGATRVPIVPLFVLLGFKFLYCLAVFGLAIAAYHYTEPAESQSVKERLTLKGLAANYFSDTPSDQQVAVKNIEQLFQSSGTTAAGADAEAALLAGQEPKIGVVQTEMGGWQYVRMAAGKVYDAVTPIVEKQLMSDANAGDFGSNGQDAAKWVSLVRK